MPTQITDTQVLTPQLKGNATALAFQRRTIDVSGSIDVTLSSAQYDGTIIQLIGALTGSINVIVPLTDGAAWVVNNNTTGNAQITVKGASGTGVVVGQGKRTLCYCDGTNVVPAVSEALANSLMPLSRLALAISDADTTLTFAQAASRIIEINGALTAGRNLIFPDNLVREFIIFNNTTGGFGLTVKSLSGTGVAVAATKRALMYCDGTNVVRVTPDT